MNEWLTPMCEVMKLNMSLFLDKVVSSLLHLTSLDWAVGGSRNAICVSAVIGSFNWVAKYLSYHERKITLQLC